MLRTEALAELRIVLADTQAPYAWSDDRLIGWMSLGQDQFCRDTGFFTDTVTYNISTVANTEAYAIDSRVIKVYDAWYGGTRLRRFYQDQRVVLPPSPGPPISFQTDQQTGMITLWPAPDAVYTITLDVWRKSKKALTHKTLTVADGEFEIPEEFHYAPVEWAAHKALNDHDRELQDPTKSAEHKLNYNSIAKDGKRAFQQISGGVGDVIPNQLYVI